MAAAAALGGCGGSTRTVTRTASLAAPGAIVNQDTGRFAGRTGLVRFQALANTICEGMRSESPPPLTATASPSAIRSYALGSARVDQRTIASLRRLGAPPEARALMGRILVDLEKLDRLLHGQLQSGRSGASAVNAVNAVVTQAAGDALTGGVPACAPRPLNASATSGAPPYRRSIRTKSGTASKKH